MITFKKIMLNFGLDRAVTDPEPIIRLRCCAKFATKGGLISFPASLVDTGASRTVLPLGAWKNLHPKPEPAFRAFLQMGAVQPGYVDVAWVKMTLHDAVSALELRVPAFLASSDQIPVLIGMADLISKAALFCKYEDRRAYMEFRLEE